MAGQARAAGCPPLADPAEMPTALIPPPLGNETLGRKSVTWGHCPNKPPLFFRKGSDAFYVLEGEENYRGFRNEIPIFPNAPEVESMK